MSKTQSQLEFTILMPCLNEAETVGICVSKAMKFLDSNGIDGEVLVADNGSTDGSLDIAEENGARVVHVEQRGYGSALWGGIKSARGKYIIMGDSDNSYDFSRLEQFVEKLRRGYDFVIGNRFKGGIKKGAMPLLHRYLGNPVLTNIGRLFFSSPVNDFHCGLRGCQRQAVLKLDLQTTGMEFASEMVVKATMFNKKIAEVPVVLSKDGRSGKPHLRSFRDGWRHLRFLLLFSPRWLFLYPGLSLMAIGFLALTIILLQPDLKWDIHSMLYAAGSVMIGFQAVTFAVFTKTFAVHEKLLPTNSQIEEMLKKLSLEKGIFIGLILIVFGLASLGYAIIIWQGGEFFQVGITITMRIVITSVTLLVLGFQLIFSSFFFNMLQLNTK